MKNRNESICILDRGGIQYNTNTVRVTFSKWHLETIFQKLNLSSKNRCLPVSTLEWHMSFGGGYSKHLTMKPTLKMLRLFCQLEWYNPSSSSLRLRRFRRSDWFLQVFSSTTLFSERNLRNSKMSVLRLLLWKNIRVFRFLPPLKVRKTYCYQFLFSSRV